MSNKRQDPGTLIPDRIRHRREAQGLAAYELAERVGISPSYISLIETGTKLPSEEILARIAKALGDDPEIYLAWLHLSRRPDPTAHLERLRRYESVSSDPRRRELLRRGDSYAAESAGGEQEKTRVARASDRAKRHWAREAPPALFVGELHAPLSLAEPLDEMVDVQLLENGADPGDDPASADGILEVLRLDSRLLPADVQRPFAYRPDAEAVRRVGASIRAGDLVVLTADADAVDPSGIYAVRHEGRVVLTRLVRHGSLLLLLAPDDGGSPEPVECKDERALERRIAGAVIATIRSWRSSGPAAGPATRSDPPGRTARLEGDFLVRDCPWRDGYGWRPVQTPADMDYLDAHPGTKIRFRLLRDDGARYLLEMSPDEWRGALGSYFDGPTWKRNGYVVAITRRRAGEYTEEFQDRWAGFVRADREG